MKPYLACGENAVGCFFVLAFYFLVRGHNTEQPVLTFVCRKWLRLAPLIIVISAFGYILHRCGYWGWNWPANIEQCLLIHDWAACPRWGQFVHPAWWCSCYMLVSVIYLAPARTLPARYVPLALGVLAIIGWRINVFGSGHSEFREVLLFGGAARSLFYLGMGALTAYIVQYIESSVPSEHGRLVTWGYTAAEVAVTGALLVRLFAARHITFLNPLLTTLCFSVLLVLLILNRGYFSQLLENNLSSFLGRYAYAIFVVHILVLDSARRIILPRFGAEAAAHPWVVLSCITGATMLLAAVGHHFVESPIMRFCARHRNAPVLSETK